MKTTLAPVPRFSARLEPAATAMVWWEPGRRHEPMAVLGATLAAGDALVAVELSLICESDVRTVSGERPASGPLVLGHESVGRIVTAGSEAVDIDGAPLRCGDRVVWAIAVPCGSCTNCASGAMQQCSSARRYGGERVHGGWELSGAFATHVHLRAGTVVVKVDDATPAATLAPLACSVANGTSTALGDSPADDLRLAVACAQRMWRCMPTSDGVTLPLSRLDDAFALAERGRHVRVGVVPRG